MRKTFEFVLVLSVITVLTALLLAPVRSSPTSIMVSPVSDEGLLGEFLIVNITVDDVTDLYLWMFRLRWNSTVLQFNSINEEPFLEKDGGSTSGIMLTPSNISEINDAGRIDEAACTLIGVVPGVNGTGTIATLNFTCLSMGGTSLEFWMESPYYEPATELLDPDGESLIHTALSATVNVIPEFSSFIVLLLLIAILTTVILGRKLLRIRLQPRNIHERR
ncbi:MAG: cohesin domain-containing protein [Candidatus Bathyarchaeota archaeon]